MYPLILKYVFFSKCVGLEDLFLQLLNFRIFVCLITLESSVTTAHYYLFMTVCYVEQIDQTKKLSIKAATHCIREQIKDKWVSQCLCLNTTPCIHSHSRLSASAACQQEEADGRHKMLHALTRQSVKARQNSHRGNALTRH